MSEPTATTIGIIVKPLSVRAAQIAGLTATAFLAGQTATQSYTLIPCLLSSPASLLARQWRIACRQIRRISPAIVLSSTAIFAWLASREPSRTTRSFSSYVAAAVLLPLCIPYSRLFVTPTEELLLRKAALYDQAGPNDFMREQDDEKDALEETTSLDRSWSTPRQFIQGFYDKPAGGPSNSQPSVHQLVDTWGYLNLGRAALMLASAIAAGVGLVSEDLSFFELF